MPAEIHQETLRGLIENAIKNPNDLDIINSFLEEEGYEKFNFDEMLREETLLNHLLKLSYKTNYYEIIQKIFFRLSPRQYNWNEPVAEGIYKGLTVFHALLRAAFLSPNSARLRARFKDLFSEKDNLDWLRKIDWNAFPPQRSGVSSLWIVLMKLTWKDELASLLLTGAIESKSLNWKIGPDVKGQFFSSFALLCNNFILYPGLADFFETNKIITEDHKLLESDWKRLIPNGHSLAQYYVNYAAMNVLWVEPVLTKALASNPKTFPVNEINLMMLSSVKNNPKSLLMLILEHAKTGKDWACEFLSQLVLTNELSRAIAADKALSSLWCRTVLNSKQPWAKKCLSQILFLDPISRFDWHTMYFDKKAYAVPMLELLPALEKVYVNNVLKLEASLAKNPVPLNEALTIMDTLENLAFKMEKDYPEILSKIGIFYQRISTLPKYIAFLKRIPENHPQHSTVYVGFAEWLAPKLDASFYHEEYNALSNCIQHLLNYLPKINKVSGALIQRLEAFLHGPFVLPAPAKAPKLPALSPLLEIPHSPAPPGRALPKSHSKTPKNAQPSTVLAVGEDYNVPATLVYYFKVNLPSIIHNSGQVVYRNGGSQKHKKGR